MLCRYISLVSGYFVSHILFANLRFPGNLCQPAGILPPRLHVPLYIGWSSVGHASRPPPLLCCEFDIFTPLVKRLLRQVDQCVATGATLCYAISSALGPALLTMPKWKARIDAWALKVEAQRANLLSFLIVLRYNFWEFHPRKFPCL